MSGQVTERFRTTGRGPSCHCHDCSDECHADIPGHFIGSEDCEFFKHEAVGHFCISTVGDYRPGGVRRSVGWDRDFETYVFDKTAKDSRWSEIDSEGYMTAPEAAVGHKRMVEKYRAILKEMAN